MVDVVWGFLKKWWPSVATVLLAAGMTVLLLWLGCGDMKIYNPRPRDEIIRNYGLLIAAFWGAALAIWRSQIAKQQAESASLQAETSARQAEIASRQAETTSRQAETALRQAETAARHARTSRRGLRSDRFQKGADMLGHKTFTVRMGGIYSLNRLAQDHRKAYLDQVIKLLAVFVQHPTADGEIGEPDSGQRTPGPFRKDVLSAILIIGDLDKETVKHDKPDLSGSNLSNMVFADTNLARMNLTGANLTDADITDANLTDADITDANLTGADLTGANLTGTIISDADFSKVKGLSQEQLNKTCHAPDCEPTLPRRLSMDHEVAVTRWEERHDDE